jgi:hypothetical protein
MTRKTTVVSERRASDEPYIKVGGKQLSTIGFAFGDLVSISYRKNKVIIKRLTKLNHE